MLKTRGICDEDLMEKLLILVVSTIGSAVGWWLGAHVGMMTAFVASMVGLGLGVWWGRQLAGRWGAS